VDIISYLMGVISGVVLVFALGAILVHQGGRDNYRHDRE
jgi:hypothetical protein